MEHDKLLTPLETGRLLNMQPRALEAQRARGDGPPFIRLSRRCVRYRLRDLNAYLAARTVGNIEEVA